ncbi:MAG: ribosomal-protein-alanine N-acetyltransferase [Polaribacter sp.]|jgi:ribosomal-protein-alanine N-acetyltransferase
MSQTINFIRQANMEELEQIFINENLCYSYPWTKNILKDYLYNQYISLDTDEINEESKYIFLVMFNGGEMVGHLVVQKVVDELHLHNICVIPNLQGKQLGQKWIDYLIELATKVNATQIILEVRESNLTAKYLYKKNNFQPIGVRKKYYQQSTMGKPENANILKYSF